MASRRITSVCHICEASRAIRTGSFRQLLPTHRRLLSSLIPRCRPSLILDINPSKLKPTPLPHYLTLRTSYRRYATTSAEAKAGMVPGPAAEELKTTSAIIEPAGETAYSAKDTSSLDHLKSAIERNMFRNADEVLPNEDQVIDALGALQRLAIGWTLSESSKSAASQMSEGSAEAMLSLAGSAPAGAIAPKTAEKDGEGIVKTLSATEKAQLAAKENPPVHPVMDVAFNVLYHPAVFISPEVLSAYVSLAATVRDASTLPTVFRKYATKPIMSSPDSKPYKPNPNAAKFSIPIKTAKAALQVAIASRNLPKALEIIDTSVGANAFFRRKTMTQVLPFWTLCGAVPFGLWRAASWLATFDNNFLHSTATGWAFTLLCFYTFYTGTIGMTALLTYNDQMLRVTWIPGWPLRWRWYYEQQRSMADTVAVAWGYKNVQEWGLESGWEWKYLRHWCGLRGMIVDDTTVLEMKEIRIGGH